MLAVKLSDLKYGLWFALAFSCVLLLLNGIISYRSLEAVRQREAEVDKSSENIHKAERLLSSIKDAETGQRGFLITGDEQYLRPF